MLRKNKENLPDTVKTGKKKKKVPLIIGGVVVAIIAVSFAASKMTPKALPQVPVSAVTKEDLTAKVDTSGTVESLRTKTYFSPVNAAIAQYPLKVGEVVKPGDSLVAFDVSTLEQENQKTVWQRQPRHSRRPMKQPVKSPHCRPMWTATRSMWHL